jgi:hypothetical protein
MLKFGRIQKNAQNDKRPSGDFQFSVQSFITKPRLLFLLILPSLPVINSHSQTYKARISTLLRRNCGMHQKKAAIFLMSGLLFCCGAFGQGKTGSAAKKPGTRPASVIYEVKGVLLDKANAPLAGTKVYLFRMTQDSGLATLPGDVQAIRTSVSLSYKMDNSGTILNPNAETDAAGRFTIKTDSAFLEKWQIPMESLVAGIVENSGAKMLVKSDGTPASLSLLKTKTVDLGQLQPEPKR